MGFAWLALGNTSKRVEEYVVTIGKQGGGKIQDNVCALKLIDDELNGYKS